MRRLESCSTGCATRILTLPASGPRREALRAGAAALVDDALKTRWLLIERAESSIQPLFLEILIAWIILIFVSFGYNAPRNATVMASFFMSAAALVSLYFFNCRDGHPVRGPDYRL